MSRGKVLLAVLGLPQFDWAEAIASAYGQKLDVFERTSASPIIACARVHRAGLDAVVLSHTMDGSLMLLQRISELAPGVPVLYIGSATDQEKKCDAAHELDAEVLVLGAKESLSMENVVPALEKLVGRQ